MRAMLWNKRMVRDLAAESLSPPSRDSRRTLRAATFRRNLIIANHISMPLD
jgi:hypothetical protein